MEDCRAADAVIRQFHLMNLIGHLNTRDVFFEGKVEEWIELLWGIVTSDEVMNCSLIEYIKV